VLLVQGWLSHVGPTDAAELAALLGLPPATIDDALVRLEASGWVLRGRFRQRSTAEVQWCERRLLARIHRLTLGILRREIEPVTAAVFMRWLLDWQHVSPGTQTRGERGTLEVLRQLQGFEAPASAWEPWLLARRIAGYDPTAIDQLSLTGAVGWGRVSPHPAIIAAPAVGPRSESASRRRAPARGADTAPVEEESAAAPRRRIVPTSVAPITFFVREDADWMTLAAHAHTGGDRGLSRQAQLVHQHLTRAGASFFADIVRATRLLKAEVETALWELVAAGLVTADGFDNLRALIDPRRRAGQGSSRASRPRHSAGRWALLHPAAIALDHEPHDHAEGVRSARDLAIEATCRLLLRRYGVVFRELLARETLVVSWRELLRAFRRLEDRGEVRGGRFVSSFIGEQFALPVAVESLRAARHAPANGEVVTIAAADPLNLVGIVVPGERVPAISGRFVRFRDGVPVTDQAQGPWPTAQAVGA
jgi:ATP-dependent Lhr-like helicase